MSLGSFYRGTTHEQDGRFKNKEKKLMENKVFPKEFDEAVDIKKVELKVVRVWVEKRVTELLGFEDEFLSNFIMSMLEEKSLEPLNPKSMHINLTGTIDSYKGFLDKNTTLFMKELWNLLLSAQKSPLGIVIISVN